MKSKIVSYRQGDVLLVKTTNELPEGNPVTEGNDIVFMHGEVTGHAHRIVEPKGRAVLLDAQAERYLRVLEEVTVTHEEHGSILLRSGQYQQAFQVEEQGQEVRRVED